MATKALEKKVVTIITKTSKPKLQILTKTSPVIIETPRRGRPAASKLKVLNLF